MLNIKKTLTKILDALKVDYVVEQGTSGSWAYRKWNSGLAELWWEQGFTVSANTVDNSHYIQYPFTVYGLTQGNAPVIACGLKTGGADLYRFHLESNNTTTTQARLCLINKHTGAVVMIPQMYIKGYWK